MSKFIGDIKELRCLKYVRVRTCDNKLYLFWGFFYFTDMDELLRMTEEKGRENDKIDSMVIEKEDGFYFFEKLNDDAKGIRTKPKHAFDGLISKENIERWKNSEN